MGSKRGGISKNWSVLMGRPDIGPMDTQCNKGFIHNLEHSPFCMPNKLTSDSSDSKTLQIFRAGRAAFGNNQCLILRYWSTFSVYRVPVDKI